ncbi:MAG: saccharopine dehydrogenase NADP-binding domain-containing protein [Anaerolineae bacterium]|nr:saccharopine dehydrogenase NADP-binding domain-containing protein [Gemmatimonadaceae bacterium]
MAGDWLLYGANGYTGELIAAEAVARGLRPVLAGRRAEAIVPLAKRLGLPHRTFSLSSSREIAAQLAGVTAILLAAGPFSATSAPVVEACLQSGVHYLDITGEIAVFENCAKQNDRAIQAGTIILPGVGFDVVPSDCLAASLAEKLPGATHVELAFAGGSMSRGTARTMLEGLGLGGAIRDHGRIRRVPIAWRTAQIAFRDKVRNAVSIPWGDVSTAFRSTGIPNIIVFAAAPRRQVMFMRSLRYVAPILRSEPVRRWLSHRIDNRISGPSQEMRAVARTHLWGKVHNSSGESVEGTLETPEAYQLTAAAAVECMRRVLHDRITPGVHTPSTAFGASFITELAGCDLRIG